VLAGRISPTKVSDRVFAELRDAILSGRYVPGERFPPQRVLAQEFGVNSTTVREALGRLEQLRLIETRHGDATRVLDWRTSGGLDALALLGAVDDDVIPSLFEARRLLLVEAARLAAARRTDEQAEELAQLAAVFAVVADARAAILTDWQFMSAVVEAAANVVFQLIMNSVRELYLPNADAFGRMFSPRAGLAASYAKVAEAIRTRDGDAAAEAIGELAGAQEARMLARRR
jgi:DNA-binding FadR family transcriptional regulator